MRSFVIVVVAVLVLVEALPASKSAKDITTHNSPDKHFVAVVNPVRNATLHIATESAISIREVGGALLQKHDFASQDGEHGYEVDGVKWTPDSQYCVFRLRSSGGHSPMFAPIVFWSRKENRFYSLNDYTADQTFSIAAPAKVNVSTWPGMRRATVSLSDIKQNDVTELR